jgi:hypothetical protein
MIRNREKTGEVEQQRRGEQPVASRHLVTHNRQIVRTEESERWLSVPSSASAGLHASRVSFITDWADS